MAIFIMWFIAITTTALAGLISVGITLMLVFVIFCVCIHKNGQLTTCKIYVPVALFLVIVTIILAVVLTESIVSWIFMCIILLIFTLALLVDV
jgi:hypothetical protein